MSTVITWKVGEFGTLYGRVGKVRYFSISFGYTKGSATPYVLRANLPGIKQTTEHAKQEDAQRAAETMLRIHLNSLISAGVELPKPDDERVEHAAQAIARTRLQQDSPNTEAAWLDENWESYWETVLTDRVRREYCDQARAALGF